MAVEASDDVTEHSLAGPLRRGRLTRRIFLGAGISFMALATVGWWQRESIANRFVADQLEQFGINASYKIDQIGVRTQRLRDVVIGDPQNPDLVAKIVEIDVALNFNGATLRDVRADGVRVRGRYLDGKLSFGELDKLSDPKSNEPFDWPDIGLKLTDATARLETPWGIIGAGLEGQGLLRNRFEGALAVRAPRLAYQDCTSINNRFDGKLLLEWRQPHLIGPLLADKTECSAPGLALVNPAIVSDMKLSPKFNNWVGTLGFAANDAKYGEIALTRPRGALSLDGSLKRSNFKLDLDRTGFQSEKLAMTQLSADAVGHVSFVDDKMTLSARGGSHFSGGLLNENLFSGLGGIVAQTKGTPVGPLMAKLIPAIDRAGNGFSGEVNYDGLYRPDGSMELIVDGLAINSASGARIRQSGSLAVGKGRYGWTLANPLGLAIRGPDLPAAQISLAQTQSGQWGGNISLEQYSAQGASLAIPRLVFLGKPGGAWAFNGNAKLTGPLADGSIKGLQLPIDGRYASGTLTAFQSCQNFRFDSLQLSSLALSGQSLRLCPDGGRPMLSLGNGGTRFAANSGNVALNGRLGGSPLSARSAQVRFSLSDGFAARDVRVELGATGAQTVLAMQQLSGGFSRGDLAGSLSGGEGHIGNVPLNMTEASGDWRYADGVLNLDSQLRISDAGEVARFRPMQVPDMLMTLENGKITAIGHLTEPTTGTRVADVDILHTLASGTGRALLAVDGLNFSDRFQPELLTPLTLGVVANVRGVLSGDGLIEWDANGARSNGRFGTNDMDLAAAFGPVEGLNGDVVFSDLLGLETAPGQVMNVGSVNPGIAALNGAIRYQLLPGQKIQIEGGRWPFAGGELILEPTLLDMGVATERRLTFRVIGMDAAKFLEPYGFDNLQVTGIFDGTLPMIFDEDGGRIVGGLLVSRAGGGEVSYLGELAYKDMGTFANFAFNALKSIRYSKLELGVGGNIAGELVTDVSFTGLQQGSLANRNFITRQLANIPIQFNVSVKAQFLQLIGSIRGLYDAQYAADQTLPFILGREGATPPITGEETTQQESDKDEQNDE